MDAHKKSTLFKTIVSFIVAVALAIAIYIIFGENRKVVSDLSDYSILGVVTGNEIDYPMENLALEKLMEAYGEERFVDNGEATLKIRRYEEGVRKSTSLFDSVMELASDPTVKAIMVMPAPVGTIAAFTEARKLRPDLILLAGEAIEDPGPLAYISNLVVSYDFISEGYLIAHAASVMGVKTVVSLEKKGFDKYIPGARREAVLENISYDKGINYVLLEIPDSPDREEKSAPSSDSSSFFSSSSSLIPSSPSISSSEGVTASVNSPSTFSSPMESEALSFNLGAKGIFPERSLVDLYEKVLDMANGDMRNLWKNKASAFTNGSTLVNASFVESSITSDSGTLYSYSEDYEGETDKQRSKDYYGEKVRNMFPTWLGTYGENTLFYGATPELSNALLKEVVDKGGYFWINPNPSPLLGYPQALGLDTPKGKSSDKYFEHIREEVLSKGLSGKLGVPKNSAGFDIFYALGLLGLESSKDKLVPTRVNFETILKGLGRGATIRSYVDFVTERSIDKYLLVSYNSVLLSELESSESKVDIPEKVRVIRPLDFYNSSNFHLGLVTGSTSQTKGDVLAANVLIGIYGSVDDGGQISYRHYPDNFAEEQDKVISILEDFVNDPKIKVVAINQGVLGTVEGFRRIRAKRPDIVLISCDTHEHFSEIVVFADFVTSSDFLLRGYLIPHTAWKLGAKNFVHISFPRHMRYLALFRRKEVMRVAATDLGLGFFEEVAPDPIEESVGVTGAQNYIREQFPIWQEKYGKETAFFSTNDAHVPALVEMVLKTGASYFVEADIPSPFLGYETVFDMDPKGVTDWAKYVQELEKKIVEAGAGGRLGTWVYPLAYCQTAGIIEFGRRIVLGEATTKDTTVYLESLAKYSPGAFWSGSYYTDEVTGKPVSNLFLSYQDTYIFGKGYMNIRDVEVPLKYLIIGTGLSN
jgi:hypothetical protein